MVTELHVQTPEDFSPAAEYSSPWLDREVAPREEALTLFAMVGRNGDTIESVRELIAVPHRIERRLLLYAERNPEDALGIERVLQFRRRMAKEFDGIGDRSERNCPQDICCGCDVSIAGMLESIGCVLPCRVRRAGSFDAQEGRSDY